MPAYSESDTRTLEAGRPVVVWDNEQVEVGSCSLAIGLRRQEYVPSCMSAELEFSGDPGPFTVEVQMADTNQDKYFVTRDLSFKPEVNESFVTRMEGTAVVAKFVRLKLTKLTNPVNVTARFC